MNPIWFESKDIKEIFVKKWNQLSNFVEQICYGQDESHNKEHMEKVANTSLLIFRNIFGLIKKTNIQLALDTITVAWLHDVLDHKFEHTDEKIKEFDNFLNKNVRDPILIKNIIERISFSKEEKSISLNKKLDWPEVLGEQGCTIRDIVSDADKLEALGDTGLQRCINFTKFEYHKKNKTEIPFYLLQMEVINHANKKLLKLKDHYIKTYLGKTLAKPLHEILLLLLITKFDYSI